MSIFIKSEYKCAHSRLSNSVVDGVNILFISYKEFDEICGAVSFVNGRPKNNLIVHTRGNEQVLHSLTASGELSGRGYKYHGRVIIPNSWVMALRALCDEYYVAAADGGEQNSLAEIKQCLVTLSKKTKLNPTAIVNILGVSREMLDIAYTLIPPLPIRRYAHRNSCVYFEFK